MDTRFMSSKNSEASDSYRLLLNRPKKGAIYVPVCQNFAYSIHGKIFKKSCKKQ